MSPGHLSQLRLPLVRMASVSHSAPRSKKKTWCEALSSVFRGHGGPPGMNWRFEDIKQFWQRFVKSDWIWLHLEAVWHNSVLVRISKFYRKVFRLKTRLQIDLNHWRFVFLTCVIWGVSWHFWGSFLSFSAHSRAAAQKWRLAPCLRAAPIFAFLLAAFCMASH